MADQLVRRSDALRRWRLPAPLLGGFAAAVVLLLLRLAGLALEVPAQGYEVDFLVGLLTTNMGLHVSRGVLAKGWPVFLLFPAFATLLFFAHLVVALPLGLASGAPLATAILAGPLSLVGAPFNLNPPQQVPPIRALLEPAVAQPDRAAKGLMMLGIAAAVVLPGLLERRLERQAPRGREPPSTREKEMTAPLWSTARRLAALVILVLGLVSIAFAVQAILLARVGWYRPPLLPAIVISYLLGALLRLAWPSLPLVPSFPERELNLLLFGPTMAIVLTYAVMAIPLHLVFATPPAFFATAALAIAVSFGGALLAHRAFRRFLDGHDAVVAATVFLAITTGWGPMAMSYLRRIAAEDAPADPIPAILPLNAFFVFPWLVILLTEALLG